MKLWKVSFVLIKISIIKITISVGVRNVDNNNVTSNFIGLMVYKSTPNFLFNTPDNILKT